MRDRRHVRTPGQVKHTLPLVRQSCVVASIRPALGFQFGERFPHTSDVGGATSWLYDRIQHTPAELLGHFEPHRLFAFRAIGSTQCGDIEPAMIF